MQRIYTDKNIGAEEPHAPLEVLFLVETSRLSVWSRYKGL